MKVLAASHPPTWRDFATAWLIGLAVVATYWNVLDGPFVFDDLPAIVENPSLRDWRTALQSPADRGLPVTGRPLVSLSLAINYAWGGLAPRGYHLVNIGPQVLEACDGPISRSPRPGAF